jgi:uncharacterized phage-associated protein
MFNDRKAGQVAAFFVNAAGGRMGVLKLVKLVYLADREFLGRHSVPITYDRLVSLPHGPVNSQTYNCVNGCAAQSDGWEEWISDRQGHEVATRKQVSREALDELSDIELSAIEAVWHKFGHMSGWELRDWTHRHCAEWQDPDGSSIQIRYDEVLRALGRGEDEAAEAAAFIEDQRQLDKLFASL